MLSWYGPDFMEMKDPISEWKKTNRLERRGIWDDLFNLQIVQNYSIHQPRVYSIVELSIYGSSHGKLVLSSCALTIHLRCLPSIKPTTWKQMCIRELGQKDRCYDFIWEILIWKLTPVIDKTPSKLRNISNEFIREITCHIFYGIF